MRADTHPLTHTHTHTAFSFGMVSVFDIPLNQLCFTIPFVVLGVGVDDLLVVTTFFDESHELPLKERMGLTLADCGSAVAVTSITCGVAFLSSYLLSMPAVSTPCLVACLAFGWNLVLSCIMFPGLLAIDHRRMESGLWSLLPIVSCRPANKRRKGHGDGFGAERAKTRDHQTLPWSNPSRLTSDSSITVMLPQLFKHYRPLRLIGVAKLIVDNSYHTQTCPQARNAESEAPSHVGQCDFCLWECLTGFVLELVDSDWCWCGPY